MNTKTIYPEGQLDNIQYVYVFAQYQKKWIFCFHKYRKSYELPGGHVEPGEDALSAMRRELYEETGITDCKIIPFQKGLLPVVFGLVAAVIVSVCRLNLLFPA